MPYKKPIPRTEQEWKAFHYWRAHPVEAVKDWFKTTPDDWQGDALNGIFAGDVDRGAFKAAHGVGKTALFAWAGWIFLNCYQNCRLVATAPTFSQLHDVLFPEFAKWHAKFNERTRDEWHVSGSHIRHKIAPMEWFGVARTSNKPANMQGFHGNDLMILGDEASGIPADVFEVVEGALSEAGEEGKTAKLLIGGNPNFTSGELYDAFNRNSDLYHRITITGDPTLIGSLNPEHASREHGHLYYSKRVKEKYRTTMEKKYGLESAVYDVRVRGLFPRAADDAIFPFQWVQHAMQLEIPVTFDPVADGVTLVLDVARGSGAESVLGYFRRGYCYKLDAIRTSAKSTTPTINMVKDAVLKLIKENLRLLTIIVDEPGVGGGVIDALRRDNLPVTAYNGGVGMKVDVDPPEDCRMFLNKRARDHWHVRRQLELGRLPLPHDEVLLAQMTTLLFGYQGEKIKVESKEDLKDRLGKDASPDRSDVIVMGMAPQYSAAQIAGSLTKDDLLVGPSRPRPPRLGDFHHVDPDEDDEIY